MGGDVVNTLTFSVNCVCVRFSLHCPPFPRQPEYTWCTSLSLSFSIVDFDFKLSSTGILSSPLGQKGSCPSSSVFVPLLILLPFKCSICAVKHWLGNSKTAAHIEDIATQVYQVCRCGDHKCTKCSLCPQTPQEHLPF